MIQSRMHIDLPDVLQVIQFCYKNSLKLYENIYLMEQSCFHSCLT